MVVGAIVGVRDVVTVVVTEMPDGDSSDEYDTGCGVGSWVTVDPDAGPTVMIPPCTVTSFR